MKINQSRRNSSMSKALLHIKDVLTVFQKMCRRAVSECMYCNGRVKTGLSKGILQNSTDIRWRNPLRCDTLSVCLKDEVVTGIFLSECTQHKEHLRGDRDISVFHPFALANEEHLSVKTDIFPSKPANFTDPESAVVGKCQQRFVIESAAFKKPCDTALGENPGKFLRFLYFGENQPSGLFKSHDFVIVLQSKHSVLKEGDTVPLLIHQRGEVSFDVILSKIVRQFLDVNHSLRNLELVVIDTMLSILSDTQLFIEARNAVFKFRHNRVCLVYECLRHGNFGEGEL